MLRLKLHLVQRTDFHKYYEPASGLFVPGSDPPDLGQRVTVEVIFQGGPRVLLQGPTTWRRPIGDARARSGVGVALEDGEQAKLRYLLGYVRGGLLDARQRRRLPVRLRVAYGTAQGRRINFTRDLNEHGAFLRTAELLELGTQNSLLVSPPGHGYQPLTVEAVVSRQHRHGPDRGVGLRFIFGGEPERERWQTFVHKLETDYLEGRLPDEALL